MQIFCRQRINGVCSTATYVVESGELRAARDVGGNTLSIHVVDDMTLHMGLKYIFHNSMALHTKQLAD